MLDHFKSLITSQYNATLATLQICIDEASDTQWSGPLANHTYNQSLFHALFFADVYLGQNLDALKTQEFHRHHGSVFGDYEELEDRKPKNSYSKSFITEYMTHVREKAAQVVSTETEQSLKSNADFRWLEISRGELHVYNIRHLQHHAAQLIMRLRLGSEVEIPWVKSG